MIYTKLPPEEIVIRPPVEAYSVLIPVTGGCSWNLCRFCGVYKNIQDYAVRPLGDVLKDIDRYAELYPNHPYVFLAGGNPTSAPTDYLVKIIRHVKKKFGRVKRISCYSKALDIVKKTDEDLRKLAEAGLTIIYMGLESGSNTVLKFMRKGTNAATFIKVGRRILDAGIRLSLYVILGLGSYKWSKEHVRETARVLTAINPTAIRFRTLNIMRNSPLWEDVERGRFEEMKPVDLLREEYEIISLLGDNVTSAVYNDHISNYFAGECPNISEYKKEFLAELKKLIEDPYIQSLNPRRLPYM